MLRVDAGSAIAPAFMSMAIQETELDLQAQPGFRVWQRLAIQDVREGLRLWRLCFTLGWLDIRLRYRGSLLGPFWLTLSTAVMVFALGFLYAELFHQDLHEYLPFLALSLVLWNFLNALVAEGCTSFMQSEGMIRSMRLPFSLHVARTVVRNVLVLAHNIVVIVVVFAIFDVMPGWRALLAIPGLVLWVIDGLAAGLLFGAFCARFRDVPPIVASVMQIAFFVTPVMWKPEMLAHRPVFLTGNPFDSLLEVVRTPLLGAIPSPMMWISAGGYSLLLCIAAWLLFARVRGRLAFWV
jgi:lipopolysaccharide transport system permease protein